MLQENLLQFLYELSQNNNRDWFEKNKKRYESEVKKPFEATVAALIGRIRQFDPAFGELQPKDCIFRIYRDTRFSADKTPYKTHLGASFSPKGKRTAEDMANPGYYLHIEFGNLMLGGGAYAVDKTYLQHIRSAIVQDSEQFRSLIEAPEFAGKFGEIRGEKNKVMPPEFKEAAKKEPLLLNKQFYYMAELDPENVLRADFVDFVADYFKAGKALNDYLRSVM